jgi:hypothetical protein
VAHIWTIVFVIFLAVGFGIAAWHDWEEKKIQERRISAYKQKDDNGE